MRRSSTTSIPIIQPSSLRSTFVMLSACLPVRSMTCRRAAFTACLAVRTGPPCGARRDLVSRLPRAMGRPARADLGSSSPAS